MLKHKNIPAIYECMECKKTITVPVGSLQNPKCEHCEHLWLRWKNYLQYVNQWTTVKDS